LLSQLLITLLVYQSSSFYDAFVVTNSDYFISNLPIVDALLKGWASKCWCENVSYHLQTNIFSRLCR